MRSHRVARLKIGYASVCLWINRFYRMILVGRRTRDHYSSICKRNVAINSPLRLDGRIARCSHRDDHNSERERERARNLVKLYCNTHRLYQTRSEFGKILVIAYRATIGNNRRGNGVKRRLLDNLTGTFCYYSGVLAGGSRHPLKEFLNKRSLPLRAPL